MQATSVRVIPLGKCYYCLRNTRLHDHACTYCKDPGVLREFGEFFASVSSAGRCYLCGSFDKKLEEDYGKLKICEECKLLVTEVEPT